MEGLVGTLEQIAELSKTLLDTPEDDRILIYKKMDPMFLKLEGHLVHFPNDLTAAELAELRFHLLTIARLDDPDDSTDTEHYRDAVDLLTLLQQSGSLGADAHA